MQGIAPHCGRTGICQPPGHPGKSLRFRLLDISFHRLLGHVLPQNLGKAVLYSRANTDDTLKMRSKALKVTMLVTSTLLLVSAFVPVRKPNPPRSLMLLGSGLVLLAGVTRRHYADEK